MNQSYSSGHINCNWISVGICDFNQNVYFGPVLAKRQCFLGTDVSGTGWEITKFKPCIVHYVLFGLICLLLYFQPHRTAAIYSPVPRMLNMKKDLGTMEKYFNCYFNIYVNFVYGGSGCKQISMFVVTKNTNIISVKMYVFFHSKYFELIIVSGGSRGAKRPGSPLEQ